MTRVTLRDLALSFGLTVLGAALAWALSGGLPAIGIDDAAITRSYAENLAGGAGYVYNVGGERVEGSTAILWVLILTGTYILTPTPEYIILLICGLFTTLAVFAATQLTRRISEQVGASGNLATLFLSVALIASPAYFVWGVWSMMELAVWSAAIISLAAHLVRWTDPEPGGPINPAGLFLPALALPLIRPEGIAVALGLIALATLLSPGKWKRGAAGIAAALAVFVAVTVFRVSYFGQPFPNTFYAKVSSDTLQGLVDGTKYAMSFILGAPFVEFYCAAWAAAIVWGLIGVFSGQPERRAILIVGAAVLGMLGVYAALGGDHFALWRFYQPIAPLLPVPVAIALASVLPHLTGSETGRRTAVGLAVAAGFAAATIASWSHYYQARFHVVKEYTLVERGVEFGEFLNSLEPKPSIGVGPAGGIALSYDGFIYDLLGLNWTEMAHANPIKTGMRNHASFDKATFWANAPDVLATFDRPCSEGSVQEFWATNDDAFDGIFEDGRFNDEYVPIRFRSGERCWPGFANTSWLTAASHQPTLEVLTWADLRILH